jgi:hemolysin III
MKVGMLDGPRRFVRHVRGTPPRLQTRREEAANAFTHGMGLLASLIAGPMLVMKAVRVSDAVMVAACVAYVIPLAAVYLCSTVSHALAEAKLKMRWELWDQATIYLLITGSYTPYAAAYLRGGWWPLLTVVMWTLALTGFFSKVLFQQRFRRAVVPLYLLLGWLPTISLPVMLPQMDPTCVAWTVGSGLCYTFGTIFLTYDRAAPFLHVLWHVAVLAGTSFHFAAVYTFVVATPAPTLLTP